jgi:predicted acyltransferase
MKESTAQPGNARLMSLDVFRGATIAGMLLVNNVGSKASVHPSLRHADWHGWTFADVIFPCFLWIMGVAMTFSFARRVAEGEGRGKLVRQALRRSTLIFGLGLLLNGFPYFELSAFRLPGVLQRIAVCYLAATLIYLYTSLRGQALWTGGLLLGYWLVMKYVPVPGYGAGVLEPEANLAHYVDRLFLRGHMWQATKTWDPLGIVSTLPAIASTLFGVLAGRLLRSGKTAEAKTAWLFGTGHVLGLAGLVLSLWFPINKNLWSSSYTLLMAGIASNVFAFCYWMIDVKGYKMWARPFAFYGMNAIAVYVLAGLLAKTTILIRVKAEDGSTLSLRRWIMECYSFLLGNPADAALLYALSYVALFLAVSYAMYRMRWFVKV